MTCHIMFYKSKHRNNYFIAECNNNFLQYHPITDTVMRTCLKERGSAILQTMGAPDSNTPLDLYNLQNHLSSTFFISESTAADNTHKGL